MCGVCGLLVVDFGARASILDNLRFEDMIDLHVLRPSHLDMQRLCPSDGREAKRKVALLCCRILPSVRLLSVDDGTERTATDDRAFLRVGSPEGQEPHQRTQRTERHLRAPRSLHTPPGSGLEISVSRGSLCGPVQKPRQVAPAAVAGVTMSVTEVMSGMLGPERVLESAHALMSAAMIDAKRARLRVEGERQMLANRLSRLKAEELRATKRIEETVRPPSMKPVALSAVSSDSWRHPAALRFLCSPPPSVPTLCSPSARARDSTDERWRS